MNLKNLIQQTGIRIFFILSLSILLFVLVSSCQKDSTNTPSGNNGSTTTSVSTTRVINRNRFRIKPATTTTTTATTTITAPVPLVTTGNPLLSDVANMQIFPTDNSWNQDISAAAIDINNNNIISLLSALPIKADFGSGLWNGDPMGIPFNVVSSSQPKVTVTWRANAYDGNYGSQSDAGPYPIPSNATIENNGDGTGDGHVIVVDKDNNMLYELYNASLTNGQWQASSGAIFNLTSDALRPLGWTSADAAGLPVFPGLVRYDEIVSGVINHCIRFSLSRPNVQAAYVFPARHNGSGTGGVNTSLPFGAKIRLKASFDISGYSAANKVILTAMKKYGLIVADIGMDMYFKGAPDSRWNNSDLHTLGNIKASNFEVVNFH